MKSLIKGIKTTTAKVLLSSFLLVCILATKGIHNNNVQALSPNQNQQVQSQPDHIDRQRHIIPTLPAIKSHEHIQFMNCQCVEYDKNTNTYNLILTSTNHKSKEYTIRLFKADYNKQLLQELHKFFYNQIVIATIDTDNSIVNYQLLDEQFTGEQIDKQGIYKYMQEDIINKLHLNINLLK